MSRSKPLPDRHRVCASVVSDLRYDARVWKELRSLIEFGYDVTVIGCRYDGARIRRRVVDGVRVIEIPMIGRGRRWELAGRAITLIRLWFWTLRTPADVYHCHNIHPGPASLLASRLRSSKLVYDGHELYGEVDGPGALYKFIARLSLGLEALMVRTCDARITTNNRRAETLRARHHVHDVTVLANVPQVPAEVEPLDPGFPRGRRIALYQGGIYVHVRAFRETLEAIAGLPDVALAIVGFGRDSEIELLRKWADELGISDRVAILPPRPFDELVRTAAAADVGLVPIKPVNVGTHLGDTNKLFEYLAGGLPVAASDLPEIRAVVTLGDPPVGELFDPNSPESIRTAVQLVLEPTTYAERRKAAQRLSREQFSWKIEEAKLRTLYAKLLDDHAASTA